MHFLVEKRFSRTPRPTEPPTGQKQLSSCSVESGNCDVAKLDSSISGTTYLLASKLISGGVQERCCRRTVAGSQRMHVDMRGGLR